jgi:hypothetical protein
MVSDISNKEDTGARLSETRWAIALEWFPQNSRSLPVLIKDYLCPECSRKISSKGKQPSPETLIATIHKCCSKQNDFINDRLPILESIFRLFLRNGNRDMSLEELGHELSQLRGGDIYRTSPEALYRVLKKDGYYGLQEVKGK